MAMFLTAAACARTGPAPDAEAARLEHERLHQRLDELVGRDPFVAQALGRGGDVQVGIQSELATAVVREVVRRYLDRVELDLRLDERVREAGTVEVGTPFGRMKAGEWQADVVVHRARGVLQARPPRLTVAGDNRVRVELPVMLRDAEGSATVRFRWDARPLATVVCRDFEVSRTIRGRFRADDYALVGSVRLAAGPRAVRAEPAFARSPFRVRVDLLPESWREVKEAVAEQDTLLRCGLAIDPEDVLSRLSRLLREGFDVRLPRSLFTPVDLPGSVGGSVALAGREVNLVLASEGLQVTSQAVWYSASVRSQASSGPVVDK